MIIAIIIRKNQQNTAMIERVREYGLNCIRIAENKQGISLVILTYIPYSTRLHTENIIHTDEITCNG